jgi:hypothetical protein
VFILNSVLSAFQKQIIKYKKLSHYFLWRQNLISLTQRRKDTTSVCKQTAEEKFGSRRTELGNGENFIIVSFAHIVGLIKSDRVRWSLCIACMG